MSLLFASLFKPYSPQVKTDRYRPTGITIPARIYHVYLIAEVVPLCERPESQVGGAGRPPEGTRRKKEVINRASCSTPSAFSHLYPIFSIFSWYRSAECCQTSPLRTSL
jgi:hypothetical protein